MDLSRQAESARMEAAERDAARAEAAHYSALAPLMRDLIHSPGWEALVRELAEVERRAIERLIEYPTPEQAGFIRGLRTVVTYPEALISRTRK